MTYLRAVKVEKKRLSTILISREMLVIQFHRRNKSVEKAGLAFFH